MSLQNSQIVKFFTEKRSLKLALFMIASSLQVSVKAWDVDLSRRKTDLDKFRGPASVQDAKKDQAWVDGLFQSLEPSQELVIMHTPSGFVPETIKLKKGKNYRVHIVNVSSDQKNVSFVADAFSQHHGTFFGQPKTFDLAPKAEGIFSFICPETSKQGRFVVVPEADSGRTPASN